MHDSRQLHQTGQWPRGLCLTSEILAGLIRAPGNFTPCGFNAGLPGFLLCQPGWPDGSVAHWLVGLLAGWLALGDQHAGRALLCPSRTAQRADQGC